MADGLTPMDNEGGVEADPEVNKQEATIQDMLDLGHSMERRGAAIEESIVRAFAGQMRRWRRAAIVFAALLVASFILQVTNRQVLDNLHSQGLDLQHQGSDVQEIKDFVRCLHDHPADGSCFKPGSIPTTTTTTTPK